MEPQLIKRRHVSTETRLEHSCSAQWANHSEFCCWLNKPWHQTGALCQTTWGNFSSSSFAVCPVKWRFYVCFCYRNCWIRLCSSEASLLVATVAQLFTYWNDSSAASELVFNPWMDQTIFFSLSLTSLKKQSCQTFHIWVYDCQRKKKTSIIENFASKYSKPWHVQPGEPAVLSQSSVSDHRMFFFFFSQTQTVTQTSWMLL